MDNQDNNFNNNFNNGQNNFYQNNVNMMNNLNNMNNLSNNTEESYPIDNEPIATNSEPEKKGMNKIVVFLALFFLIVVVVFMITKKMNKTPEQPVEETPVVDEEPVTEEKDDGNVALIMLGQPDAGKTPTTSAITKLFGEYITEEELGKVTETRNNYSYYASKVTVKTEKRNYTIYDPQGNKDIIKMLIGEYPKIDGAILVVNAMDETVAQIKDQINVLSKVGIKKLVVYINEPEDTDIDKLFLLKLEIRSTLEENGYSEDTPLIEGNVEKFFTEEDLDAKTSIKDLMRSCDNWIKPLANAITQTKNSTKFKAEVYFMGKEEGGRSGTIDSTYKPNIRFDKGTISSEIKFPDGSDQVYPGEHINLTITLELKTKIQKGKYFDIIENDKVIGFGIITELIQ